MDFTIYVNALLTLISGTFLILLKRGFRDRDQSREEREASKRSIKELEYEVDLLRSRFVTASEAKELVKELLVEKVTPLETSLNLLEQEVRAGHKETTVLVHRLHLSVAESFSKLEGSIEHIKGKIEGL